ncbi:GNAT family N-acetyltransferase [Fusibacter tunisiensis]|uniref:RimJ/RimL family protein N-acetyltransferase n=1 Tax=Fusibacter tunisiensis TaxID=1008308 RepID=A0ABS2MU24_9FIRM|nr:GNAT family protein [Fusibacter tunisiensis]MBM7562772.1 RimJ/RimL family protein N-acetyltransferase [Fusibacter tunisiensis]
MPKVKLRDLSINDVEDRYNWSLDREVIKFLSVPDKYPPFTKEETTIWIQTCIDGTNGYLQKSILTKDNIHIGWVDFKNFDKVNSNAELGITIGNKDYWGQGYGSAAIIEMLDFGFEKLDLHKIWLRVDKDNERAIKSYKKIGFVEEGILREDRFRRGEYIDRVRFSILKSELR